MYREIVSLLRREYLRWIRAPFWIISGLLKFIFDDREILVAAGEVLLIPPHAAHRVEALEDTLDVDFFAPRREDWIRKDDSYLRG